MARAAAGRVRWIGLAVLWPLLLGQSLVACSAGQPSMGFIEPSLTAAYIPLAAGGFFVASRRAAAVTIAPEIAVTNAHNANLIAEDQLIARSRDYDLLFFRTGQRAVPAVVRPRIGQPVIAYGQGRDSELREAKGTVMGLEEWVAERCEGCMPQRAMVFDAEAGGGFSGGPVVDAETGAIVGITFGYVDGAARDGGRRMYAYDMALVMAEMRRLVNAQGP